MVIRQMTYLQIIHKIVGQFILTFLYSDFGEEIRDHCNLIESIHMYIFSYKIWDSPLN